MSDSCCVNLTLPPPSILIAYKSSHLLGPKNLWVKTGQIGYALSILEYIWGLTQEI